MTVSAEYAAKHLEDLFLALDNGEAVEITRLHKPAVLLQHQAAPPEPARNGKRVLGAGGGEMPSISWEEWKRIDREWKSSFLDESDVG